MASALAQETYVVPSYMLFSTSSDEPGADSTELDGETGSRLLMSKHKSDNEVDYNALRLASSIIEPTGDLLKIVGSSTEETGGFLMTAKVIPGITQTTNFDIDATIKIRFE